MRKGLGSFAHGYLLGSLVLASLALLPSSGWADRGKQEADRSKDRPQVQAQPGSRGRQAQEQRPAPDRLSVRAGQPGGSVPAAPVVAGEAARTGRASAFTPARPQVRQAPGPSQAPRVSLYQNYRQPQRADAAPQAGPVGRPVAIPGQGGVTLPSRPALQQVPARERPAPAARAPTVARPAPEQADAGSNRLLRQRPAEPLPSDRNQARPAPRQPERGQSPAATAGPALSPAEPAVRERRLVIPEASFRGSGSETKVRAIAPNDRKLAPGRLQAWVRGQNSQSSRLEGRRPAVDVVGNAVPTTATLLSRSTPSYRRIASSFGVPRFPYVVVPGAVWGGGFFRGAHRHRTVVVVNLYYPFYYSDPGFTGFYYAGYYPSVYCYFGWSPGWVYPERIYYAPADYVYVLAAPYGGYRLDERGAAQAIADVRRTWLDGDIGPLAWHLTDQLDIRVYFEGKYSYTTATDDFYAMTLDTLATVQTLAMEFDDPIWISSHEVFYTGWQVFEDPDGLRHTVYVSFRFRNLSGEWYLVAVGTSRDPIEHQYTDFRYR